MAPYIVSASVERIGRPRRAVARARVVRIAGTLTRPMAEGQPSSSSPAVAAATIHLRAFADSIRAHASAAHTDRQSTLTIHRRAGTRIPSNPGRAARIAYGPGMPIAD